LNLPASAPHEQTAATTPELHAAAAPPALSVTNAQSAVPLLVDTEVDSAAPTGRAGATDASTPAAGDPRPTSPPTVATGEHPMTAAWVGAHDSPAADLRNPAANPDEAAPLQVGDAGTAAPRQAGPLTDVLPVDAAQLQEGIRSFLGQLDRLGAVLTTSPSGVTLYCWLLAASAAGAAAVIVRRQAKRQPASSAGDPLFSWPPEADGTSGEGPL
jgi:hypothetical protein